jgi:hypothetical protein
MFDTIPETYMVTAVGAFGGILLGLAARLGRFCTMGAIEDMLYGNSDTRMRMWIQSHRRGGSGQFRRHHGGALRPPALVLFLDPLDAAPRRP